MSSNDEFEVKEDVVLCLDASEGLFNDDTDDNHDTSSIENINFEKTLPPGVAPEGFIVIDESIEANDEKTDDATTGEPKESPLFKVMFRDDSVARQYRKKVKDFFRKLVSADFKNDDPKTNNLVLEVWTKCRKNKNNNKDTESDHTLFTIDNTPGNQDKYNVPTYGKKFEKVLKRTRDDSDEEKDNKAQPKLNCFNCLGNHNLRDCTEERNQMEINKNRKEFNNRSGPRLNVRYHVEDQKFKPGVLSSALRKALGLADNQLPRHIYNMRKLGYPPGWLEEAKLEHSGINLYNSEGNRELDPTEEVGEIFCPETKTQYDMKKVHEYPGYNIPAPDGTRDAYWHEDEQMKHSKETMLGMMSSRKADEGYKRKKLKRMGDDVISTTVSAPAEMDVEDLDDTPVESVSVNGHFVPPLPKTPIKEPAPSPPSPEEEEGELPSPSPKAEVSDADAEGESLSLNDLENRKKFLLIELDDSSSQSNPASSSSAGNTPKLGSVISVELGTPIIESTSPYTKLPTSDKFSKDICDVINFENLPGATGKYEKLSGLLNKVRGVLTYEQEKR